MIRSSHRNRLVSIVAAASFQVQGSDVELRCNECGALVGVVQIEILRVLVAMIPNGGD